jgi:hypothetical protein
MKPELYNPAARVFANSRGHSTQLDGSVAPTHQGAQAVRDMQMRGLIGEFGYVVTHDGLTYMTGEVPYVYQAYVIVQRGSSVLLYHYGLDSLLHPDWREFLKLYKAQAQ